MAAQEAEAAKRSCEQCENPDSVRTALRMGGRIKMKEASKVEESEEDS